MINAERLRNCIEEKGLKYGYIAERLDITVQSLQRKIDGIYDFKLSEVISLIQILNLNWDEHRDYLYSIFFNNLVEK